MMTFSRALMSAVVFSLAGLFLFTLACSSSPEYPANAQIRLDGYPAEDSPFLIISCFDGTPHIVGGSATVAGSGEWTTNIGGWYDTREWYWDEKPLYSGGAIRELLPESVVRELLVQMVNPNASQILNIRIDQGFYHFDLEDWDQYRTRMQGLSVFRG